VEYLKWSVQRRGLVLPPDLCALHDDFTCVRSQVSLFIMSEIDPWNYRTPTVGFSDLAYTPSGSAFRTAFRFARGAYNAYRRYSQASSASGRSASAPPLQRRRVMPVQPAVVSHPVAVRSRYRGRVAGYGRRRRTYRRSYRRSVRGRGSFRRRTGFNRNIFNRKFKKMRRYNRAPLMLYKRLVTGQPLPESTFAKLHWRGSGNLTFVVNTAAPSAPGNIPFQRSLVLNDIRGSPMMGSFAPTSPWLEPFRYFALWKLLYRDYLVLGAKIRVSIKQTSWPIRIAGPEPDTSNFLENSVPLNAQPGYYYIRCYYFRASPVIGGGARDSVGHPIDTSAQSKSEQYWSCLSEFLQDTTVTWKKDPITIRRKLAFSTPAVIQNNSEGEFAMYPTSAVNYEVECSSKPIVLTAGFSAKKHWEDTNILRNGPWRNLMSGAALPDVDQFRVRFGYIGFDASGQVSYHIPLDRQPERFAEIDVKYAVAWRTPLMDAEGPITENINLFREAAVDLDVGDNLTTVSENGSDISDYEDEKDDDNKEDINMDDQFTQ